MPRFFLSPPVSGSPWNQSQRGWALLSYWCGRLTALAGVQSPEARRIVTAGRRERVFSNANTDPTSQVQDPGSIQQHNKMEGQDGGPPFWGKIFSACMPRFLIYVGIGSSESSAKLWQQTDLGCLSLLLLIN